MNGWRRRQGRGFSLLEVIFAIAMLSIGIMGILSLFTTGIARATWASNTTAASMEAQSLLTRIMAETDNGNPPKRIFLERLKGIGAGGGYVQATFSDTGVGISSSSKPVLVDKDRDIFWVCYAKPVASEYKGRRADNTLISVDKLWKPPLDPNDPLDLIKDKPGYSDTGNVYKTTGLYEVGIGVWKNWKEAQKNKKPIVVFTTFVDAGY
jgi:prepilin-type N-terminal cleavage/methylation domain-containing protein